MAGCKGDPPAGAAPSIPSGPTGSLHGSPVPDGSRTASPGPIEFTVDGAGPYQLGAALSALQSGAGLDNVKTGGQPCPDNTTAQGKGVWKDIQVQFHKDGTLYLAINKSTRIPTPSGAWVGSTLTQLKTIYGKVPGQELKKGAKSAYLVPTMSGRGVLFDLDDAQNVTAMIAGEAAFLKSNFTGGSNFC
jgi:hypothetical protein